MAAGPLLLVRGRPPSGRALRLARRQLSFCLASVSSRSSAEPEKRGGNEWPRRLRSPSSRPASTAAAGASGCRAASPDVLIKDGFYPRAGSLRKHFDDTFDPSTSTSDDTSVRRFCWDHWHVPNQYTLLRTPAEDFFRDKGWTDLESSLLRFAERELGCSSMTPVWTSCYIDGCVQELHADVPHGPWAFVYSLTEWDDDRRPNFTGGETQMLRPEALDYWRGWFDGGAAELSRTGLNRDGIVHTIEPRFNRLTVFDPRVPHGVREVRGPRDVREGRLVLHGWFHAPAPFCEGGLATDDDGEPDSVAEVLNRSLEPLFERLSDSELHAPVVGMCSVRVRVGAEGGAPSDVRLLASNLKVHPGAEDVVDERRAVEKAIVDALASSGPFPSSDRGHTDITLPLVFE